jgi:DnaJ-class molecular chaperone
MNFKKACEILDIDPEEDTSTDLLKKKYRIKALKYHPDKNKSDDASSKFQEIQSAYEYLSMNLEYDHVDSDSDGNERTEDRNNYKNILFSFLKNIMNTDKNDSVFRIILNKISNTCESKALDTLEKLDKTLLIKINELIKRHKEVFHFSGSFFDKVDEILKKKIKNDECIILNPQLDDLFENNLYKLKVGESVYAVPLWHHELVYDNSGSDIYVKCNPILPENVSIDNKNNIYVKHCCSLVDIWDKGKIELKLGEKTFYVSADKLRITKNQTHVLEKQGISKINTVHIYDVSKLGDIIIDIEIS